MRRFGPVWFRTIAAALFVVGWAAIPLHAQERDRQTVPPGAVVPARPPPATAPTADAVPPAAPDTIPVPAPPGNAVTGQDTVPGAAADTTTAAREAAAASDTILQALKRLPGFIAMEYRGDSASFNAEQRVLRLFGASEVVREGDKLTAEDTIVYREATRLVEAYGNPAMTGQAQTITGNVMFYDLATRRATVRGARTQVAEAGANWFVRGDVTAEGSNHLFANRSIFTTDDREEPAYYFEADNIKVIRDRILVGRPARLYFRNVPVFWLPFVAQDLTRGRRSGLLAPEFSINDIVRNQSTPTGARGTGRQISNLGFYWAMSDYMDAQFSGAWRSGDYTGLRGALRYRWNSQFLDGSVSYSQFWRETGSREMQFFANNSWRPDERTSMSLNANFASSQFLREITTDYLRSTQNIASNFKLNRRFDWGTIDMGANRQQSLANDQVQMELPQLGIMLQSITFLQEASPERQRWYNNATLNLGSISYGRSTTRFGGGPPIGSQAFQRRDADRSRIQVSPSLTVGNFSLGSGFNLNRNVFPPVAAVDTGDVILPRLQEDIGAWNGSLSYRVSVIGETSVSPTLAFSQDIRRDTLTAGAFAYSPTRMSLGASTNTALYGFLPGVGPFSMIRHKLTPGFSYSYVPQVDLTPEQERIFGPAGGRMQNNLSLLSLNQTFEAKMRDAGRPPADIRARGEGADTLPAADAVPELPGAQAGPPEERKVTLLSISTSGFNYDFAPDSIFGPRDDDGQREFLGTRRRGFTTRQVTNSISSDYLRGLQISMTHDLFDQSGVPLEQRSSELGRFSPTLTGLSTQFSLGQDSPFLRWLGLGGRVQEAPQQQTDSIPTQPMPTDPLNPMRRGAFTVNPQAAGRGPWRMDIGYSLYRPRDGGLAAHDLRLGTSFSPTPNWGVNWYTNYSIEDGRFGGHQITLRRDLYRWEANFNFSRTPYGNTSFDVLIRLKDLPDLKVDDREDNIGGARRGF
jgi:hypothetical protein